MKLNRIFIVIAALAVMAVLLMVGPAALAEEPETSSGQIVLVPVSTSVYIDPRGHDMTLAASLNVLNADRGQNIEIRSVEYRGPNGEVLAELAAEPTDLPPLGSIRFLAPKQNFTGDRTGACFLVRWVSTEGPVTTPTIYSSMIGADGNQGISFLAPGRVLEELAP